MPTHRLLYLSLAILSTVGLAACTSPPPTDADADQSSAAAESFLADDYRSVDEIRDVVVSGEESAEQIVQQYLDVIDAKEDDVNALISLNPKALAQAQALDERIAAGEEVGVLAGSTFVVKDNIDVEGLVTTAGSIALSNNYANATAPAVQKLLDEDAILIGKANLSEFLNSYGQMGYSSAGGLTVNPANTSRTPSGSSGGTGAAVAAGMATFGLGTDTSGSVRDPASVAGMVGVRPTFGLVARTAILPYDLGFDTVGAITATVDDQRTVLEVMAGSDDADPDSLSSPDDFTTAPADRDNYRVGVVRAYMGGDPEVDESVNDALSQLRDAGVEAEDVDVPEHFLTLWSDVLGPVDVTAVVPQVESYLAGTPAGVIKSYPELTEFYQSEGAQHAPTPTSPKRVAGMVAELEAFKASPPDAADEILNSTMPGLRAEVEAIMSEGGFDALVFPTMSCVANPRFDVEDTTYTCESDDPYTANYLASATGLPEVTVPAGVDDQQLPIGVSFLGGAYSEGMLLELGKMLHD